MKDTISVVIPVYDCSACLIEIAEKIISLSNRLGFKPEIIFVDDCSPDNAWEVINEISLSYDYIKGIRFARNFGQHQAISAGLKVTTGEWIIVMDCDLQDDPNEIEKLYLKAKEGYHIVYAKRMRRKDRLIKIITGYLFHRILSYFTNQESKPSVANFGIYSRKAINAYNGLTERNQSFPILIRWFGFKSAYVSVDHCVRKNGKSSYTIKKLFKLASEIIISHSNKPLYFSIILGVSSASLSFTYSVYLIIRYLTKKIPVQGWTSIMVSVFLIGGILLINLGVLGIYIGRIFDHIKQRPNCVIEDEVNIHSKPVVTG